MKIYKVKYDVSQGGKKFPWKKTDLVEASRPPKVGSSQIYHATPAITETIISVEEVTPNIETKISLSTIVVELVEKTRLKFFEIYGQHPENNRKLFIDWYIKTHDGTFDSLINDLSSFYLHIDEDRINRYINE